MVYNIVHCAHNMLAKQDKHSLPPRTQRGWDEQKKKSKFNLATVCEFAGWLAVARSSYPQYKMYERIKVLQNILKLLCRISFQFFFF